MENFLLRCNEQASEVSSRVSDLRKALGTTPVPPALISALENFKKAIQRYEDAAKTKDVTAIADTAKNLSTHGHLVGHAVQNTAELDELLRHSGTELMDASRNLQRYVDSDPSRYRPLDAEELPAEKLNISGLHAVKKSLEDLRHQVSALEQRINRTIHETDRRAAELSESVNKLQTDVNSEIKQARGLHDQAIEDLSAKRVQIDEILGHASGRVVAGDYTASAGYERTNANWLRIGSLVCMVIIIIIVGYAFWEAATKPFDPQAALFRLLLAFMLSVPAGYLARESARHRKQQYRYLQTSLDLKAIAPYLSSLPEDEQHRIKAEVARRIFGNSEFTEDSIKAGIPNVKALIELVAERAKMPGQ